MRDVAQQWGIGAAAADVSDRRKGGQSRGLPNPALGVLELVAAEQGVSLEALTTPNRGPAEVALARQLALYLCYVTLSLPMSRIGRLLGRDRSTVSHACAKIEDMRDDPVFDALVSRLEEQVAQTGGCERLCAEAYRAAS